MVAVSLKKFFFQAEDGIRDPASDWSSDVCSSDLLSGRDVDVLPQPFFEDRLAEGASFEMAIDESDDGLRSGFKPRTIEPEKNVHAGESNALVAVDETVVHRETFPQCRRLLDQIGIVAGLRTKQQGYDQPVVADTLRTAEQAKLLGMDVERVV